MQEKVNAYCMSWHIANSPSLNRIFINPLKSYFDFNLIPLDDYGRKVRISPQKGQNIFCQVHPPFKSLENTSQRVFWIPMWDGLHGYPQKWWNDLPKNIRIIAYSEAVKKKAISAGLETLEVTYYEDPSSMKPVNWNEPRKMLYWNRRGMIDAKLLEKLCASLDIKELYFRGEVDPGSPSCAFYNLPNRLGSTDVIFLPRLKDITRTEYLSLCSAAQFYIGPRAFEGVGLTFLEAMAAGSVVFAYDAPTMNEYIKHGETGYLWHKRNSKISESLRRLMNRARRELGLPAYYYKVNSRMQDWIQIRNTDYEKVGKRAREQHLKGYEKWLKDIDRIAKFILDSRES